MYNLYINVIISSNKHFEQVHEYVRRKVDFFSKYWFVIPNNSEL